MERASLIGSAYKRRALVDGAAGRRARIRRDLQQMRASYQDAQDVGEKSGASDVYYPAVESSRRRCGAARRHASMAQPGSGDRQASLRKSLKAKSASDPDFWSVVGETELDQYEALAEEEARARPQAAGEGLRGSAQARDGHPDVGVGVRHGVPGVAELCEPRDRQRESGGERAARATAERSRTRKRTQ